MLLNTMTAIFILGFVVIAALGHVLVIQAFMPGRSDLQPHGEGSAPGAKPVVAASVESDKRQAA